jgi:nucleoside-diphosphate-sugar epimerase
MLLDAPDHVVDRKIWNAGYDNLKVREIADMVKTKVGDSVDIVVTPSNDHRSYHVSSQKIRQELGFIPRHSVEDAIVGLKNAFDTGLVPGAMTDDRYYNIKRMQAHRLR